MIANVLKLTTYLFILFTLIGINNLFSQELDNLFNSSNRTAFGNYLFCEGDYLRAIDEFKSVLSSEWNDSLQFKIATSYYRMGQFDKSIYEFQKIEADIYLNKLAKLESIRSFYQIGDYNILRDQINVYFITMGESQKLSKLYNYSLLLDSSLLPEKSVYLSHFNGEERNRISEYYDWKIKPPYKNPTKAAIMSALVPGLGKIYANEVGDGITAFLLTGLFTYLAVDKFQNNHTASGWLYASIAAFFYSGNIYGSATAVQNYNAGIKFNFNNKVKFYLNERDQFIPIPKYLCD
ncbi:MAG: hypothetical protein L3J41_04195 [Melioribacteraceae bacterium]|nr:hypothetical protein [Melioribacteraceae bacterium]